MESSSEGSNWAPLHEPSSEGSQADYRRRCKFDSNFDYDSDSIYAIIFRMVCTHCGSQSHHTGHSACANYCTLCKESGQPSSFKAAHPSIQRGTSTRIKCFVVSRSRSQGARNDCSQRKHQDGNRTRAHSPSQNAYIANAARVRFASRNAMLPSHARSRARKP